MTDSTSVSDHYSHGELLRAIEKALDELGIKPHELAVEDLAPVDEFHIGGRAATQNLLDQLDFGSARILIDVGCGLGGAARYVADSQGSHVTGIDLTPEYIATGRSLCEWVGLQDRVSLQQGSALSMPFADESFDGGYMLHVGMNIDDKAQLFREIFRVLRAGAAFGVYDVMRIDSGDLVYPVPWANDDSISCLATPDQYRRALTEAGFEIGAENNRRDFAIDFFARLRQRMAAGGGPPALGLHTLMKESTAAKVKNMVDNIAAGYIAPVEMVVNKPTAGDVD
ncbi:MAG: methyltransferase domain-containing protein [Gammaproteobacteria bacterium]|nr:methyltransferase domain-containing protein [Gammaproteobacteria bacterium]